MYNTLSVTAWNNKTCFFYLLYSDKTWVFDQSEHMQGPIYIVIRNISQAKMKFLLLT